MSTDDITPEDRDAMDAMARALPRVSPSPDLGDRIVAAASADATPADAVPADATPAQPLAEVISLDARRSRRRVVLSSLAAAACAAAVAVGVTLAVTGGGTSDPGPLTASTAIVAQAGDGVSGTAALYGSEQAGGMVQVRLSGVPAPPANHHYEVWVLEKGSTEMTSVGSFTPSSRSVDLMLPLPAPADYAAVDISVEPNGGSPAHSGTSLAGAKFA
ncbi:MAG: anti-sigma factor [Acidobacteria bacterium]|nr:anti-sigma factor [Acidobacteriota bacterium]